MPWDSKADVARHNKAAAKSPKKRKQWKAIANKLLSEGKSEGQAIRTASGVVGRAKRMYGKSGKT
jgi:uncharacterized protein YdaT